MRQGIRVAISHTSHGHDLSGIRRKKHAREKQHVYDSFLTLKNLQLSKQDEFLQDRSIFDL